MNINKKILNKLYRVIANSVEGKRPDFVYLGIQQKKELQIEIHKITRFTSNKADVEGIPLQFMRMGVIEVMKENFIEFGYKS